MKIEIEESNYSKTTYHIRYRIDGGKIVQSFGERLPIYRSFKKYGFESEALFILAVNRHEVDIDNDIKKYNRAEAYKRKFKEELNKYKVKWKRLNEMSEYEKQTLAKSLRNTKGKIRENTGFKQLVDNEYLEIRDVSKAFNFAEFGLSDFEWLECSFFEGYLAIAQFNKMLSFDSKSMTGIVFDIFDLLNFLFDYSYGQSLIFLEVEALQFQEWQKERLRYDGVIEDFQKVYLSNDYKYMCKLLKNSYDFYIFLLNFGKTKIGTDYLFEEKSVFFCSLRYILEIAPKELKLKSVKQVGNRINLLCSIGLLEKVMGEEVPFMLQVENGNFYDNNYFFVDIIDFKEVERRCVLLKESRINISNICYENIYQVLGENIAKSVFNRQRKGKRL